MKSHPRSRTAFALVATLFAVASATPALGAPPPGGTFTDDDGSIHEGDIEAIAAEGVTKGCNPPFNDRFCPSTTVDRGAFAAFLRRALDLPATGTDYFVDDEGSVFEADINAIAEAGITRGCNPPANDRYCPTQTVRRDAMAALLRRALGLPDSGTDFFTDDEGSIFEADINAIAEAGITKGCNPPANTLYCPLQTVKRDTMASFLTRAFDYTPATPPTRPPLGWEFVVGLASPIQTIALPGEDRLLIAQQSGLVRVFDGVSLLPTPFLDISGDVIFSGEKGLLSIAVHPDYPADRRLFAWFSGPGGPGDHTTYLVEYDIAPDLDSASSPRTVLEVDQPYSNHNGGKIGFGPDGYLYLGLGDGGSGNDPQGRARDIDTLLGKMIRIDVDGALPYGIPPDNPYVGVPGRDEIWAIGLRNPWRWSIHDDVMYIGDVGQAQREEVNAVPLTPMGYDFGWSRYEGTLCNPNDTDPSCSTAGLAMPLTEYGRNVGRTVTGGVVYEGPTVRKLLHFYLYADVFSARLFAFRYLDGKAVEAWELPASLGTAGIVDFGLDDNGEILVTNLFEGAVYRLTGG